MRTVSASRRAAPSSSPLGHQADLADLSRSERSRSILRHKNGRRPSRGGDLLSIVPPTAIAGRLCVANNWPDSGEPTLTRGEKLAMGIVGVVLTSVLVSGAVVVIMSLIGPRPSALKIVTGCAIGLSAGLLWVRPWETGAPKS